MEKKVQRGHGTMEEEGKGTGRTNESDEDL